jgi:hypothetical protein
MSVLRIPRTLFLVLMWAVAAIAKSCQTRSYDIVRVMRIMYVTYKERVIAPHIKQSLALQLVRT